VSITLSALSLTCVNTLFYGYEHQYAIYIVLLIIAGFLYTLYFIDAHVIYSASLQLELICCYSVLKTICINFTMLFFEDPDSSIPGTLLYYVVFWGTMVACSVFFSSYTLKAPFDHPYRYYITITVIPLLLLLLGNLILNQELSTDKYSFVINLPIVALLIATHYLSYLHINSYNELIETRAINQHMDLIQRHIERSSALVEQIRRDKHEMKNVYFYIHTLLESGEIDELTEFVDTKLLHRYDRLEEFHTGYKILDYLLSQKACEAQDAGISFFADINMPEHLKIENNDICSILQNLLDNAIDASHDEKEKDIHLKIIQQKNYLSITVKNRSSKDVLKSNPLLITTKADKKSHGIGTKVIKRIVEKYDGAIDYSEDSGYFIATILLTN
nr:ATP-binding protein [Lachnospiraceae bacterium]